MRTNYVLIDYENVQPSALCVLEKEHFKVVVFVGANQAKVAFDVAAQLQRLGPSASYVKGWSEQHALGASTAANFACFTP